ncbi:DUF5365 family protein [Bacillus sp. CGMCC 1.16541]|uniref:DUF5365 family protein n=1 Tax=Bacillus sp. CGMCC 1.16541 TaxID=2185143 RepID=UPI000D7381B1|nr:DUF5365 family protein [Bacillus sp. CGMCC 1.16541]
MRIAYAAPSEVEEYIEELTEHLLYDLLPQYVSESEFNELQELHLLNPLQSSNSSYNGLLEEALQIVCSLQALIAVIQTIRYRKIEKKHQKIFEKNVQKLEEFGFCFPFSIEHFSKENCVTTGSYHITSGYKVALN